MSVEANMALARRIMEARATGDLDALDELLAPDFVNHNRLLPGQEPGREGYKRAVSAYHAAFSNRRFLVEDQVAAGDKVVTRLMPDMSYEENKTVLVPGESVLFYTDGLVEAHDRQGEMFGTPRLRSLLAEYSTDTKGLNALLLKELERFTGEGWEQEDDITLVTLRRSASLG